MRRLFGTSKDQGKQPATAAPSLDDAAAKISAQVQNLDDMIAKADEEIKQLVSKGGSNPSAKQRALQAMKRKKMYEQQRDQLLGTQFNVETLKFQQDQADITLTAVAAMKAGQDQLKKQTEQINVGAVDKLRDDMEELADEMKAIGEALGGASLVDGAEDDELAAEFAKMEEEMAAEALAGSIGGPKPMEASLEDEYARLAAEASSSAAPVRGEAVPSAGTG
uniref:Charged multivesicular body protein 5 n=1 Tax=Pyrodinium bahamense TaxID=73915 RepID=A0A7S0B707_9DINO|mmetsp:Transcript_52900/g.146568  ORF Transcript_52900/g.146568 Transcript_52900/m.146568 type:complete len:222 (+) Transcript_52900:122-787(+)|eukprot:CAMPEP_0179102840 /NCGR_PEP_ID=MMETSP0796-20121207/47618_1 /TAXON_ID=73915 /ORGANISM="Pyrodinium bahamense, Strain pbaha01" /LENGTH=221 /DNA_ID=CAMNT_0020800725 /DNA_START=125 /DNA_END=790 /DNA_ORIENTATION=+